MTKAFAPLLVPFLALLTLFWWVEGDVRERAIYAVIGIAVVVVGLTIHFILSASKSDEIEGFTTDGRRSRATSSSGRTRPLAPSSSDGGVPVTFITSDGFSDCGSGGSDGGSCGGGGDA